MIETTLRRRSFDLNQTKHVKANVVSLLIAAIPSVPEDLEK